VWLSNSTSVLFIVLLFSQQVRLMSVAKYSRFVNTSSPAVHRRYMRTYMRDYRGDSDGAAPDLHNTRSGSFELRCVVICGM